MKFNATQKFNIILGRAENLMGKGEVLLANNLSYCILFEKKKFSPGFRKFLNWWWVKGK